MQRAAKIDNHRARSGVVIVAARLMGRDGENLGPLAVREIRYAIFVAATDSGGELRPRRGFENVIVEVGEVLFAELQLDDDWHADCVGYNFRHAVPLTGIRNCGPTAPQDLEIHYLFTLTTGETTLVRFRMSKVTL